MLCVKFRKRAFRVWNVANKERSAERVRNRQRENKREKRTQRETENQFIIPHYRYS